MKSSGYAFAEEDPRRRLDALAALFDPVSFRHFEALGVDRAWRCWEVGAGGASVVDWLARRVGETGQVLATDIDITGLADRVSPAVDVRRHDVTVDDVPLGRFDLVHARHVLLHLPTRVDVITRMISALRPGGWVLIEDYDHVMPLVCVDAYRPEHHRANKVHAGVRTVLAEHGVDFDYARALPRILHVAGLHDVGADAYFSLTAPAGNMLGIANVTQLRETLVARSLATVDEVDGHLRAMADGTVTIGTLPLISAWGRQPC
jgi:SAM-dependent methyltransferase